MRILQVISTPPFAWATGGPARFAYGISRELSSRGHDVTMVTTNLLEPNRKQGISTTPDFLDGIRILRFPYIWNYLAWKRKIYLSPRASLYLIEAIREYDIVHLQDLISIQAIAVSKGCQKAEVPHVLTTHGSIGELAEQRLGLKLFMHMWGRDIIREANRITALTACEAGNLVRFGADAKRIEIIPNGIDVERYRILPRRGSFRAKFGISDSEKVVLYLGRIHRDKGLDLLCEAFSHVAREIPDSRLVLVGPDDGYLVAVKALCRKNGIDNKLIATGFIKDEEKVIAFLDSDVHVTPKYQGFPTTFLESCACMTPIITTTHGDRMEWINGRAGYVTDYDCQSLSGAITRILGNPALRESLGRNAREIVFREFGWKGIVSKLESLYGSLLRNG